MVIVHSDEAQHFHNVSGVLNRYLFSWKQQSWAQIETTKTDLMVIEIQDQRSVIIEGSPHRKVNNFTHPRSDMSIKRVI